MNVTIYGPNLPSPLSDKGTMHVHRTGCAHLGRYQRLRLDPPWNIDVQSVREVVTDIYSPNDFEYDPDDPDQYIGYVSDIYFAPCTKELPDV